MSAHNSLHQAFKYGGSTGGSAVGTVNGPAFDTQGMEEVLVVLNLGLLGAGTLDVKVQESASAAGTYTDVTGASFTQMGNTDDNKTFIGRLLTNKSPRLRYLRIVGIVATAACNYGAGFIGAGLHDKPVTQDQTIGFDINTELDN